VEPLHLCITVIINVGYHLFSDHRLPSPAMIEKYNNSVVNSFTFVTVLVPTHMKSFLSSDFSVMLSLDFSTQV
jgi:hypothetical protein